MQQILASFPQRSMRLAFAYGSGVFQQSGNKDMCKNMIDFVFAVDNPVEWHTENLLRNRKHYSFLGNIDPKYISYLQDRTGARIYYNTLIPCEGRLIKYGVISTRYLIDDLLDWETLYISGRLHKPVNMLKLDKSDPKLNLAISANLQSAVHASLLMLPEQFTEEEKVGNIVRPNLDMFRQLYAAILEKEEHLHWNQSQKRLEQSQSAASNYHHLSLLPKWLMFRLVKVCSLDGRHRDTEQVLRSLANDSDRGQIVQSCLAAIVRQSSLTQTVKGILTAGVRKSVVYGCNKLRKMMKF